MNIRIRFDQETGGFGGELYPNPVAVDLAASLPLQLTFSDFNGVEKVARLDEELVMNGVPASDEPTPGEIGYYAPTRALVLYYGLVGRWPGLVRIGRFDLDLGELRALPDGFTLRIERDDGT